MKCATDYYTHQYDREQVRIWRQAEARDQERAKIERNCLTDPASLAEMLASLEQSDVTQGLANALVILLRRKDGIAAHCVEMALKDCAAQFAAFATKDKDYSEEA